MLVLDTDQLAPQERADAFQSTVSANCSTSMASFEDASTLRARMHVVDLGPAKVFTIDASGTTLRRTPQMARAADERSIVLALPVRTHNRMVWARDEVFYGPSDLMLVDLSVPYVYGWRGLGASYALHVDVDYLGLPRDDVHAAARDLRASPLYQLVRDHIGYVTTNADTIADSEAAVHVGAASAELMRALVVSAAGSSRRASDVLHASLTARVQAYVRAHLADPDLGAASIAAANGLSVRALYKLYESLGLSLERSIISQRLDGARTDLAAPRPRYTSIAATARAWGFANPSFFSTRFREAFGVTPRQWHAATRPTTSG